MAKAVFGNDVVCTEGQKIPREAPHSWLDFLVPELRQLMKRGMSKHLAEIEEIRLRLGRPLVLRLPNKEVTLDESGTVSDRLQKGIVIGRDLIERSIQVLSQGSLYAWEEEIRNGYITITGGHRVGLTGRGVLEKGEVKTLKEISGVNYRIGRQILGCADGVLPYLVSEKGTVCHTLVVSPPQCGKTTLLRDIVRQISNGVEKLRFAGVNVGLVDERSEVAGVYRGVPQFEIGMRTDVLDACPKAQGMIMMIRSMSPGVVATDEIGKSEDVVALYQALQAGVSVVATVHGGSLKEVMERPVIGELLSFKFFERLVLLSRGKGPGTVEAIYGGRNLERMK